MAQNQIIMLAILVVYLILNAGFGMIGSKRQDKKSSMNFEKKYFIGSRGMARAGWIKRCWRRASKVYILL